MNKLNVKILGIPNNPGCYIYKNSANQIIYIGKAKNLKKRVLSYFSNKDHDKKTAKLVQEIVDLEYIVTESEVEALLLEARLIRENKPKYNIDLKNSVRYAYIKLTDEKFPRLLTVRKTGKKGKYFGPYTDGSARARILLMAVKMFKVRTCSRLPKKACLQYYIGNCQAPCIGLISEVDYQKKIKQVELFLKGDIENLTLEIKNRISESANKKDYEQAIIFRDQLQSISILQEKQKVDLYKKTDQDLIDYIEIQGKILLQLFHVKKGAVLSREQFEFVKNSETHSNASIVGDFIKQYYFTGDIPHEIILSEKLPEQELLIDFLENIAKRTVEIVVPKQGVKKELLGMVKENLILSLEGKNQPLVDLRDKLNLATLPRIIECFDVSNLGSTNIVGSMVRFRDGVADKDNYRKFKIKSKDSQDDFAGMAEIVGRRYCAMVDKKTDLELPDLIVVDGGLGQLHIAHVELEKLALSIPIIGLAKKEELIYTPGTVRSLRLSEKSSALKLLQKIRDEAHRFAIGYNKKLRKIK